MKYLIADLNIKLDGHKYGFIDNLIKYVGENRKEDSFVFLINFNREIVFEYYFKNVEIVRLLASEQNEVKQIDSLLRKSEAEWKLIEKYCIHHQCQRLILMELDLYQIAIGKRNSPFDISGIWFRPYSRIEPEGSDLKSRLNYMRVILQKKLALQWALRNRRLNKVFILNDKEIPTWLNKKTKKRFFMLPDPYFDYPLQPGFKLRDYYSIPGKNLILLQFGYMDERKNNENIIAALNRLEALDAGDITLLIIGKFKEGYENYLKSLANGRYQLITRNEFISNEEMESTFSQSDLILRMNVGFFASSGIIGIAARHNKPLLVSDNGLVAHLTEEYKLGVKTDPLNQAKIAREILNFKNHPERRTIDGKAYRDTHTLADFAETLLS